MHLMLMLHFCKYQLFPIIQNYHKIHVHCLEALYIDMYSVTTDQAEIKGH